MEREKYKGIASVIIIAMHVTGIVGMVFFPGIFLHLVPFHLVLSSLLVLFNQKISRSFILFCLIVFLSGWGIEALGVNTSVIFGAYRYTSVFGPGPFSTPLLIGLNWLILIYSTGVTVNRLRSPIFIKIIAGAFILVVFDFIMEPVAQYYNFWVWESQTIPLRNYVAWWLVSFAFLWLFFRVNFNKINPLAYYYLSASFIFFILLNIAVS